MARDASPAEIRSRYLTLVARYHPDRHQGNPLGDLASERVTELNAAYEVLSDPARRAVYDSRAGDRGADGTGAATGAPGGAAKPPPGAMGRKAARIPLLLLGAVLAVRLLPPLGRAVAELFASPVGRIIGVTALVAVMVVLIVRKGRGRGGESEKAKGRPGGGK